MLHIARHWAAAAASQLRAAGQPFRPSLLLGARPISNTAVPCNVGSHMSDNDPEALKHHKELHFKGQSPNFVPQAEGWSETLASVSEAVVKAEQEVDADSVQVPSKLQELQRHTVEVVQQLHHAGEEGAAALPKRASLDVSGSPAHAANIKHTNEGSPQADAR